MPRIGKKDALVFIEIHYDIRTIESIEVSFDTNDQYFESTDTDWDDDHKHFYNFATKSLSKAMRSYSREYYSYYLKSINIQYTRHLSQEKCEDWPAKRNTGFNVTWHHQDPDQVERDHFYVRKGNQHFIRLANVIHEEEEVDGQMMDQIRREKKNETHCEAGQIRDPIVELISRKYEHVSLEPIHTDHITEETLSTAFGLYFEMIFCPNYDPDTVRFYQRLFKKFSLEAIIKTLARILFMSNNPDMTDHYIMARVLFDHLSTMLNIDHKNVAAIISPASQLEHYEELKNLQIDNSLIRGEPTHCKRTNLNFR